MQGDLEALYMAFKLGAQHLHQMLAEADDELAHDLEIAKSHLLQAAEALAPHIDPAKFSIVRQTSP